MSSSIEQVRERLGRFFVEDPLYKVLELETPTHPATPVTLPSSIHLPGAPFPLRWYIPKTLVREREKCNLKPQWEQDDGYNEGPETFVEVEYHCRSCKQQSFRVWIHWRIENGKLFFRKVGQFPGLRIRPSKDLERALGRDRSELYTKAITLRHHNYGLGALVYFRRLIEETTDEMLDLVISAIQEIGGHEALIREIAEAKQGQVFQEKVKFVAEVLPDTLRPGGVNPFRLLYGLLSKGIHSLTEEECIEIADGIDRVLSFIYRELKVHAEERGGYVENLRELHAKYSKPS